MSRAPIVAFTAFVAFAAAAHADILAPGTKWVSHNVRFENLKDFPDHVFYLKSIRWREQDLQKDDKTKKAEREDTRRVEVQPFQPDGVGQLGGNPIDGPKWLFAVSKKLLPDPQEKPLEKWFYGDHEGVLKVQMMHGRRSAPVSEKRDSFLTVYRIDIADGKMTATVVSDEIPGALGEKGEAVADSDDDSHRLIIGGSAFIVALAIGLFIYFRRRG